jgi:uncharacterized protein YgiM (DUF1202 family)
LRRCDFGARGHPAKAIKSRSDQMKTLLASAAIFGGMAIAAGTASAATPGQCEAAAQQYAEAQYPTGGGAVSGAVGGAILGGLIAGATGNKVGNGVGVGAGAGLVVGSLAWQNAKKQAHDSYFANCLGGAQPVYAPAPPVYGPPPSYPTSGPFNAVINGASSVNVRNGPGTNYPVVGQVYAQQGVSVAGCGGGWCQIYLSTGIGFVSQTYVYPIPG